MKIGLSPLLVSVVLCVFATAIATFAVVPHWANTECAQLIDVDVEQDPESESEDEGESDPEEDKKEQFAKCVLFAEGAGVLNTAGCAVVVGHKATVHLDLITPPPKC